MSNEDWRSIENPPTENGEIWIYCRPWDCGWQVVKKYYYVSEGFKKRTACWMPIYEPKPPTDVDLSLYDTQ